MSFVFDLAYLIAAPVAAPLIVIKSLRTGKYRSGWAGRLGMGEDVWAGRKAGARVLMLHCVSVGELLAVTTLVKRLLEADGDLHIVISTTTDTGTERAGKLYPPSPPPTDSRVHTVRFPLDFSFAVESVLDRVRPDAVALVELETWPNFLEIAESRRIPVAVINGRLSERSFPRYRLIRPIMKRMLRRVEWLGVQTETIAERFRALGAESGRIEVIPTLKYDNAQIARTVAGQEELGRAAGISGGHRLLVAGSTGPGEEEALLDAYMGLRGNYPELRLAIAPRHPEVVAQVAAAIGRRGLAAVMRTERGDGFVPAAPLGADEVFVLNTLGELKKLYGLAFAVFVGRSLVPLGGSDMIEAAALGKPCLFGPHTGNFAEVVELLTEHHAAMVVEDGRHLTVGVEMMLKDAKWAGEMGRKAQSLISQQRGSTERYVEKLLGMMRRGDSDGRRG